jgi:hypothetical protein
MKGKERKHTRKIIKLPHPSPSLRGNLREKASPPAPLQGERGVICLVVIILAHTHFVIISKMNALLISPSTPTPHKEELGFKGLFG